jgi:hypothetical protein
MTVIKVLQGRMTRLRFSPLMGIVSAPLILTNGRVIDNPGYDARTGLYFDPLGTSFPPIPKKPTQEDAQEALNLLDDLLQEFPFTNDASKAVALSGLLTAVSGHRFCLHARNHGASVRLRQELSRRPLLHAGDRTVRARRIARQDARGIRKAARQRPAQRLWRYCHRQYECVGLTAWLAKAGNVLISALVLCIGLIGFGLYRKQRRER